VRTTVRSAKCEVRVAWLGLLFVAASHLAPRTSHAQGGWRTADRAVIGSMSEVYAVASSFDRLYVVGSDQVIYREPLRNEWVGPFQAPGWGELQTARGSIIDPYDRSLWIVTASGWLRYDAILDVWDRGVLPGTPRLAGIDRTRPGAGLYFRVGDGWVVAERGGGGALPVSSPPRTTDLILVPTINDLVRSNPQLAPMASGMLMGPGLRPVPLTAAAPATELGGWWLGTRGGGLLFLPHGSAIPESKPWGLPGPIVGGVFGVPGGAWLATSRTAEGGGAVVHLSEDLGTFQWFMGDRVFGQSFQTVLALTVVDSLIWVVHERGLLALDRRGQRVREVLIEGRVVMMNGVFITAVAARQGRMVVAAPEGLFEVTDSGAVNIAPAFHSPAFALAISGDTTWVGTILGLFAHLPGTDQPRQAPGWEDSPGFRTNIVALLWRGDTLVALGERSIFSRDPSTGRWTRGADLPSDLGRPRTMADGEQGIWIAGSRGLVFVRLNGVVVRRVRVGDALPGDPRALSVSGEWLWVGTTRGLVRLRREGLEP
jgi:hypothetical protein